MITHLRQLEYFLAVVDHGGVHRAAAAVHVSQPSLSQGLRALEGALGTPVFHRVGRRLVLTPAGEALVLPARTVLRELASAQAEVDAVVGLRSGRVDVASMPSQAVEPLSELIRRFRAEHAGVTVSVQAAFTVDDVLQRLRDGRSELGVLAARELPKAAGVTISPLTRQRFVLIAGRDAGFAAGAPVRREELAGRRFVAGQPGTGMRQLVEELRATVDGIELAVETEHREAILPLVLAGVGVAVLTESWSALAARAGALVLDLEPSAHLDVGLARRDAALSPAAERFLELALADSSALSS